MTKQVTVSARIDVELRRKLKELGIKPSEVIRKALEREVEERLKLQLYEKVERASEIIRRVGRDAWIKAVRESREER
ncbi:DUF4145 domain-containing protein [Candidatus Bathyarchaeota archaeon]|nr:MAG: DUF4145 domain-containing protein [Candidatus Bathyarchaeota archaeon]